MTNFGQSSARGGLLVLSVQAVKFTVTTAATVMLARLLTPEDFGLIAIVAIIYGFLIMFQSLGLSTALIQWPDLDQSDVSGAFWAVSASTAFISALMLALGFVLAWYYRDQRLGVLSVWFTAAIVLNGLLTLSQALLYRRRRFGTISVIQVCAIVSGATAAVWAASQGAGYIALALNIVTIAGVSLALSWLACPLWPSWPGRSARLFQMLRFGVNLTGAEVFAFWARSVDQAVIGFAWGPQQLGFYSKAYQLLMLPLQQVSAPLASVMIPTLSRLAAESDRYKKAYLRSLQLLAMVAMPGIALMVSTADWLVLLVLGDQWLYSAHLFVLLGLAAFVQPVTSTAPWLLISQQRSRDMLQWSLISFAVLPSAVLIGLPWGPTGVALSYALGESMFVTPLLLRLISRQGPVGTRDILSAVYPSAFAAAAVVTAVVSCREVLQQLPVGLRLAAALCLSIGVTLVALSILPRGRRGLSEIWGLVILVAPRSKNHN